MTQTLHLLLASQVRFVKAGVAISRDALGKFTKAVLVEELINNADEEFRKYAHNTTAEPAPAPTETDYTLAAFLCFSQHVQWTKTGGLAFVSNFQGAWHSPVFIEMLCHSFACLGSDTLLSDPQIMTHP